MIDLLAAVGVLILLGGIMAIAKLLSKRLTPEGSRKTIHITMGCAALTFPFIFDNRMSVVYLGIIAIAALLFLRVHKGLREGVGTALLGIQRKSLGDIYFVISIVIVYVMHKSVFEYIIPIAVLTFADSIAALIGTSYGRSNMAQHDQEALKSKEGSVMFFIVAFICTLVPLQLMTEIGRAEVLVLSFLIGFLAAIIEVVSRHGNDNLLLPLLTYSFLRENTEQSLETLFINFGSMLFFVAIIFIVYKLTNITKLSILYSLLVAYVVMILGGLLWIIPPLILFITFGTLPMMKGEEKQMIQSYKAIECNAIVGVICLYVSVFFPEYRDLLYVSFSLSFAIHLAINSYSRMINFGGKSVAFSVAFGLVKSAILIALPAFAITRMNLISFALFLLFIAVSMPFAVALNRKFDYKIVTDSTINSNKSLVGAATAVFTVIIGLIGGLGFYAVP